MGIFKEKIVGFVTRLEKYETNPFQMFLWLVFIGFTRCLLEEIIFLRQSQAGEFINYGIYISLFYIMVYLAIVIIIKIFSGEEMVKVINASIFLYSVLLIAPLIDYYIHRIPEPYRLVSWNTTLIDCLKRYPGITITGLYMMFLAAIYIAIKKGIGRSLLGFAVIYLIYYYVFASVLFQDIKLKILSFGIPLSLPVDFQKNAYLSVDNLLFLLTIFILFPWFLYLYDRRLFNKFLQRVRFERAFQYLLILTFSFSMVGDFHPIRFFIHFFNMVGICFVWVGSVFINDYYDYKCDKLNNMTRNTESPLSKSEAYAFAIILWVFAAIIALQISQITFMMYLIVIVLSYLYSTPPVRLKRSIYSPFLIGASTFMLVLIGIFAHINNTAYNDRVFYLAVLLGIAMAGGINVIDLKDYKGDLDTGIKSLPTVFGLKKAKVIIAGITCVAYLLLGYYLSRIMRTPWYYLAILQAIAMPFLVMKYRDSRKWWALYLGFHYLTLFNGILINIYFAYFHLIFKW